MTSLRDFVFGKKSVPVVSVLTEVTRDGIQKAYIPKFLYKPSLKSFLNYKIILSTWGKTLIVVRSVIILLKRGSHRIKSFVQTNADLKVYTETHQRKEKLEETKFVNIVKKNFMLLNGEEKLEKASIAAGNVMLNQNHSYSKEKTTLSTLMGELRKTIIFIYSMNGEHSEKKFMKGTIGLVKIVERKVENYTHTIKSQLAFVKTLMTKRTLLQFVGSVTKKFMGVERNKFKRFCVWKESSTSSFGIDRSNQRWNSESVYTQVLVSLAS